MAPKLGTLMFPGESIDDLKTDKNGKTVLGPGLRRTYAAIHIIKAGILQFKEPNEYWIESPEKRVSIRIPIHGVSESIMPGILEFSLYATRSSLELTRGYRISDVTNNSSLDYSGAVKWQHFGLSYFCYLTISMTIISYSYTYSCQTSHLS